jgi:succinate dehydrogenase / fumarate reductase iron-sulfur subunit
MVVLDALHRIQATRRPTSRSAGTARSPRGLCSAEVDGRPRPTQDRPSDFDLDHRSPSSRCARSIIRDLVTDVSWNYEVNKTIQPFAAHRRPAGGLAPQQQDIERPGVPEAHRVLLCQDVRTLRNHETEKLFMARASCARRASTAPDRPGDRRGYLGQGGIGYCNITALH